MARKVWGRLGPHFHEGDTKFFCEVVGIVPSGNKLLAMNLKR